MQMKLEVLPIPVSDVDRAKEFYTEQAGFNADHDHAVSDEIHQSYVPGRDSDPVDVLVDCCGIAFALWLSWRSARRAASRRRPTSP